MANTTNFGWETPDDTDLVKDGAAAMRTLGNSIDASFVDLKGGTSGQILSKNSNTDLDFTWIANDQGDITAVTAGTGLTGGGTAGAVTLTNDMATTITAAGDIVVGTGSGTYDNLPIGTTGQVLTADTTVSPYKVKWETVSSGSTFTLLNSGGTALTGATSITVNVSEYSRYLVRLIGASSANTESIISLRINGSSSTNYEWTAITYISGSGADIRAYDVDTANGTNTRFELGKTGNNAANTVTAFAMVEGGKSTGVRSCFWTSFGNGTNSRSYAASGNYLDTTAITSLQIVSSTGNLDAGTVYIYGAN